MPETSAPPPVHRSLSARLLVLTVLFVMLAEVMIFAPSIGRYRHEYLNERLAQAHLALLALEATADGMVDERLQMRLLHHAGARGMTAWRPNRPQLMLGEDPPQLDILFDLQGAGFLTLLGDGLAALVRTDNRLIGVIGESPKDPEVVLAVSLDEAPMRREMLAYGKRILILSLIISLVTATLVYVTLHLWLVRPILRLAATMAAFRRAPEDPARVLRPSRRRDEVGVAERALAVMQTDLRAALAQQARLAAVGTAVSKISHDLKGVLSAALLESDRLEATAADPEIKHVTAGIARALDRAVHLCSRTLSFAKEGPPDVRREPVALAAVVTAAAEAAAAAGPATVTVAVPDGLTVLADACQLPRVFENLIRNAAEAGAGHITVSAAAPAPGGAGAGTGRLVAVTVADDGPGLPPRARDNLFQPFSGSARVGGTGLGLPIAREIAQALGGDLVLDASGPGGTVFRLTLPIMDAT